MNISMKKRYVFAVIIGVLVVGCCITYYNHFASRISYSEFPVYEGEELLGKDTYPFTFVFFGDNRPEKGKEQPEIFIRIIEMINEKDPLFVIGGGDFVVEGTPENFEEFLNIVSALKSPLFYVCGNHDDSPYYEEYLGERVYAFTYKNSLFVILDNSRRILDEKQLHFLEKQLQKGFEYTFVFFHMPPFDPEGTYSIIYPGKFMEIVQKYKVDYVFCSHIHAFYEEKIGDTTLIISGGAGAPLSRQGYFHFVIVNVGDSITCTVVMA